MFIILSKRAARSIDAAEEWWRRHRDKAPRAMAESLAEAFAQIREQPESSPLVPWTHRRDIRLLVDGAEVIRRLRERKYANEEEPAPEQETELEESFAEYERGEWIDGDEFLKQLRRRHRAD